MEQYFAELSENHYSDGIKLLQDNYIELRKIILNDIVIFISKFFNQPAYNKNKMVEFFENFGNTTKEIWKQLPESFV